jgi:hypothetical protein
MITARPGRSHPHTTRIPRRKTSTRWRSASTTITYEPISLNTWIGQSSTKKRRYLRTSHASRAVTMSHMPGWLLLRTSQSLKRPP